ncbi:hypothetical protein ACVWYG_001334 [Pedobacter sp. UYEF25]
MSHSEIKSYVLPNSMNNISTTTNEWKVNGEVAGIKARGNLTLDFEWKNGKVVSYKVYGPISKKVKIRINGKMIEVNSQKR